MSAIPSIQLDGQEFHLTTSHLPLLIHGAPHVGASYFANVLLADCFDQGNKIIYFSARAEGADSLKQLLTGREAEIGKEVLIPASGNVAELKQIVDTVEDVDERIVLIKNIEAFDESLFKVTQSLLNVIYAGDLDACSYVNQLLGVPFRTEIFFSKPQVVPSSNIPDLKQYEGYYFTEEQQGIIAIGSSNTAPLSVPDP